METAYNPKTVEDRIYKFWDKGYFHAQLPNRTPQRPRYESCIPHPNALLHRHPRQCDRDSPYGHYGRNAPGYPGALRGCRVLPLLRAGHRLTPDRHPERGRKQLKKDKSSRHALGRTKFVERVWQWKEEFGNTIIQQLKNWAVPATGRA